MLCGGRDINGLPYMKLSSGLGKKSIQNKGLYHCKVFRRVARLPGVVIAIADLQQARIATGENVRIGRVATTASGAGYIFSSAPCD